MDNMWIYLMDIKGLHTSKNFEKMRFLFFCIFEKYKILKIFPASFKMIPWKLSEI